MILDILVAQTAPVIDSIPQLSSEAKAGEFVSSTMELAIPQIEILGLLFCTGLVFLMNLGFAGLETGLIRAKNTTNVLFKNILIPVIALLAFTGWGFNLLFPGINFEGGFIGFSGFGANPEKLNSYEGSLPDASSGFWIFFLYHCMLASIAATIVSGAVAERIKFMSFLVFVVFFISLIYPIVGMWHWGGGWLSKLNPKFHDYSGGAIVHTVGGYAALVGAALLGPRVGKYIDGKIFPLPGHNMPLAAIGLFIIWFGWIGFMGGASFTSQEFIDVDFSFILITSFIAAASGCLGAFITSYLAHRTHDITMSMNGILAGLVAISASANIMSIVESVIIGLIAGLLVVFSVLLFDKLKIDDPVGAISVHLVCGTWGILAVGIFGPLAGKEQFISQLIGTLAIGITVSALSFALFFIIKKTIGLRITLKDEMEGLDLSEHGMKAYNLEPENN